MPTKKTGNVKKSTPIKKESARKVYIDNIWAEAFWRAFESIKHTAPAYEPDREELSLAIRAELAVVKAEEEKKAREEEDRKEMIKNIPNFNCIRCTYLWQTDEFLSVKRTWIKNWYSDRYVNSMKKRLTKRLIRSIISSLWLWATAMFLILSK